MAWSCWLVWSTYGTLELGQITQLVVAAAVLMLGACAAAHLASFGGSWLPAPAALLGALVPGVLGILAAVMSIPDRARWAEEEWYVEEEK